MQLGEITSQQVQMLEGELAPWVTRSGAGAAGEYVKNRIHGRGNDWLAAIFAGETAHSREPRRAAEVIHLATRAQGCGGGLFEDVG